MTEAIGMLTAFAPFLLLHVAMIVFGAIGGRRQRLTAFWLLVASGGLGALSSVMQILQFTLMREYGVSRMTMFAAISGTISMAAGVFEVVAIALLALRRQGATQAAAPSIAPGGQIMR
jgi:hypothetical protein